MPASLIAVVGASFLARTVVGWLRATPSLFPDEYTYASLGRSLAEVGRPLIRGGAAHFPALLEPLVTAPVWWIGDVGLAYRVLQTIGALAMSLAAVPVFLLARRVGVSAARRSRSRRSRRSCPTSSTPRTCRRRRSRIPSS